MTDQTKNLEPEKEKISSEEEMREVFEKSREAGGEKTEMEEAEAREIREILMREVLEMEGEPELKKEAERKAKEIGSLALGEKIKHLIEIARQRDLPHAVHVAKNAGDPNLLDSFHDYLKNNGHYKEFIKSRE